MVSREAVRSMLRYGLPDVMVASVFLALSVAAFVLYRLRERDRNPGLLGFGVFAFLYGARVLATTGPVDLAAGGLKPFSSYADSFITYMITIPILFPMKELFPAWRTWLHRLLWFTGAFATAGILSDAIQRQPGTLYTANNIIVLLTLIAFLIALFRQRVTKDLLELRVGVLLFSFTLVVNNLFRGLLRWELPLNPEPWGLLAMLISLGSVLARRAIQNEERLHELDKELEIARRIQTSILPRKLPAGAQWDIAVKYLPMTAVAGDFYDFFVVDQQRIGVIVADVSGHGVPAALIASMVKVAFASQLAHADSPARVLSGINKALCGNLKGQFVTAAYLYLDLATQTMRYGAAGHPALFWFHIDGKVEEMVENGLMLGFSAAAPYSERECAIHPGDRFLLYTDGLLEAANAAGEFFGEARAQAVLTEARSRPALEAITRLVERVLAWSHSVQDDITLVAVGFHSLR